MTSRVKKWLRPARRVKPGRAPGLLVIDKAAPKPVIDSTVYSTSSVERQSDVTATDLPSPQPDRVTWVNVVGLGDKATIETVAAHFGFHPLAVEDVVLTGQRPKIEDYGDHLYIVIRLPSYDVSRSDDADGEPLSREQVSLFVGPGYVVTWQERAGDCFEPVRKRIGNAKRAIRSQGTDFLAYALIDAVVDSYYPVLNAYSDRLDTIEDRLIADGDLTNPTGELLRIRQDVRALKRDAWSQRAMLQSLPQDGAGLFAAETLVHVRDVADHATHIGELLESLREGCGDLHDLHMSLVGMRTNEVMKVLTILSAVFIPLSFIAGLYGMNFSREASPYNMPETEWRYGYPVALGLMATTAAGMLAFFAKLRWLRWGG